MQNPYLVFAAGSLLLAIYLFAALKFPALMFIFRLKRTPARLFGVDEEKNRQLSLGIGKVLAPILGTAALIAAGCFALQWKKVNEELAAHVARLAERTDLAAAQTKSALTTLPVGLIYKGSRLHVDETMQPALADAAAVEGLLRKIGATIDAQHIDSNVSRSRNTDASWKVEFKVDEKPPGRQATFVLHVDDALIALTRDSLTYAVPASRGFVHIRLPEEFVERFRAIGSMSIYKGGKVSSAR